MASKLEALKARAKAIRETRMQREPPVDLANRFAADYVRMVSEAFTAAFAGEDLAEIAGLRLDAGDTSALRAFRARFARKFWGALQDVGLIDRAAAQYQLTELESRRSLARVLALSPQELPAAGLADNWLRNQAKFGRDLAEETADRVVDTLRQASVGTSVDELRRRLEGVADISRNRAQLIATNETLTLNADLDRTRQQKLGVRQYRWRSSRDGAVRDHHSQLNGRVFSWDDPPLGGGSRPQDRGHPGQGIRCRCTAEPLIPGVND